MSDTPVKVDISGIDKVLLLRGLWTNAPVSAWCRANGVFHDFDEHAAKKELVELGGCFDYFYGRVIKSNLKGDTVNPWGYDRDNGEGAFQKVNRNPRAPPHSASEA